MQSFDEKEGRREFEGKKVEIGAHDFELTEFQRSVIEWTMVKDLPPSDLNERI